VNKLEEKIKGMLVKTFDMNPGDVAPGAVLGDDLEMDSLEIVEMVVALEKEFNIEIGDGIITPKNRLSDVIDIVRDRLK